MTPLQEASLKALEAFAHILRLNIETPVLTLEGRQEIGEFILSRVKEIKGDGQDAAPDAWTHLSIMNS